MESMYGTEAMGKTAENLAEMYNISREDQDAFACQSQMKATAAQFGSTGTGNNGCSHTSKGKDAQVFEHDEFIKPNTSIDVLATLKPVLKRRYSYSR